MKQARKGVEKCAEFCKLPETRSSSNADSFKGARNEAVVLLGRIAFQSASSSKYNNDNCDFFFIFLLTNEPNRVHFRYLIISRDLMPLTLSFPLPSGDSLCRYDDLRGAVRR